MIHTAIYSGSFDPPTDGHVWMIGSAANLFDKLYVGVGTNPGKKYMFTISERIEMIKKLYNLPKNVEVVSFENMYLVEFANKLGVTYIIRGLRSESDYLFERGVLDINNVISKEHLQTIFLMPPQSLQTISSSMVKGLIGYNGWEIQIKKFVPLSIADKIIWKVNQ